MEMVDPVVTAKMVKVTDYLTFMINLVLCTAIIELEVP